MRYKISDYRFMRTALCDVSSAYNYHMLHRTQGSTNSLMRPGPLVPLHLKTKAQGTVYCRSCTTDINVFDDVFRRLYHLPPDDIPAPLTILDLGSNIGLTMVHYADLFPEASILGIELDRGNYEICLRNIEPLRNRCAVVNGAVWREGGLKLPYGGSESWGYRIAADTEIVGSAYTVTIDDLLDLMGWKIVDFMKVDVEGAEKEIFRDRSRWVERIRCLKVEVHEPYSLTECIIDLTHIGFRARIDTCHPRCVVAYGPPIGCVASSPVPTTSMTARL